MCLDVCLIRGDYEFHSKSKDIVVSDALMGVGKCLETLQERDTAAKIYTQVADHLAPAGSVCKAVACLLAGSCLTCLRSIDDAEDYYLLGLSALCRDRQKFDINEQVPTDILEGILHLYETRRNREIQEAQSSGKDTVTVPPLCQVLVALLYTAGFQAKHTPVTQRFLLNFGPEMAKKCLKQSLRENRKEALHVLVKAISKPGHVRFQQSLMKIKDPKYQGDTVSTNSFIPEELFTIDPAEKAKDHRKLFSLRYRGAPTTFLYSCANCEKQEEEGGPKYMKCPCHNVFYCCKECQVSHWRREHKHFCPLRKKK